MKTKSQYAILVVQILVAALTLTGVALAGPLRDTGDPDSPGAADVSGGAPRVVSYQGRVTAGGSPYSGTGYFKFAVVNPAGTVSYWSNDGNSSAGSQPAKAVALPVNSGLFSVLLGDTSLPNMTRALTATAFRGADRSLRVWFSKDNTTFTLLSPDVRLASAPFALQAEEARNADYTYYPMLLPQTLDLAGANADLSGFSGGFTDGRYAYFVPFQNCAAGSKAATLGRVDLQDFSPAGVSWLDLSTVNSGLRCFLGGFTDGRYGYLAPFENGRLVRIDLQNFTAGGVSWIDLTLVNADLHGYLGGFTDGRYAYLSPYWHSSPHGKVVRVDLANFTTGGVSWFDFASVNPGLVGFSGAFTDGRYGYFVPSSDGTKSHGRLVRLDLLNFSPAGVAYLDLSTVSSDLVGFVDGFTDGRYGYLVPSNQGVSGKIARFELANFSRGGVSALDLAAVNVDLKSFVSGFTDGRFGYFLQWNGGKVVRLDLQNFSAAGVYWTDLGNYNSPQGGYTRSFTDGRYAYLVPFTTTVDYWGVVARIQLFSGTSAP